MMRCRIRGSMRYDGPNQISKCAAANQVCHSQGCHSIIGMRWNEKKKKGLLLVVANVKGDVFPMRNSHIIKIVRKGNFYLPRATIGVRADPCPRSICCQSHLCAHATACQDCALAGGGCGAGIGAVRLSGGLLKMTLNCMEKKRRTKMHC